MYFTTPSGARQTAQIIYGSMTASVVIYIILAYAVIPVIGLDTIVSEDTTLPIIEITLSVIAVITLAIGYYLPRFIGKRFPRTAEGIVKFLIVRVAFFNSVGIFGLVLSLVGSDWMITLPFLLISLVALVLSFPTRERWQNLLGETDYPEGNIEG